MNRTSVLAAVLLLVLPGPAGAEPGDAYFEARNAGDEAMIAGDYAAAAGHYAKALRLGPRLGDDWRYFDAMTEGRVCAAAAMRLEDDRAAVTALGACGSFEAPASMQRSVLARRRVTVEEAMAWLPEEPAARVEVYQQTVAVLGDAAADAFKADLLARDDASARAICAVLGPARVCEARFTPVERLDIALTPEALARLDDAGWNRLIETVHLVKRGGQPEAVAAVVRPAAERLLAEKRLDRASALAQAADLSELRTRIELARFGDPLAYRTSTLPVLIRALQDRGLCVDTGPYDDAPCSAFGAPIVAAWVAAGRHEDAAALAQRLDVDPQAASPDAAAAVAAVEAGRVAAKQALADRHVAAWEQLRATHPEGAEVFRRLAARHGHALDASPLPAVAVPQVSIRLAPSSSVGCGPVDRAGLARTLAENAPASSPLVVEVTLSACSLRFDRECKGGQYVQKGVTRERLVVDPVKGLYKVRETAPDQVITWEDCGDQYFLLADVSGRLVARDGDRQVTALDGSLAATARPYRPTTSQYTTPVEDLAAEVAVEALAERVATEAQALRAARWEPELRAGRAAEQAGDHRQALEHFARARRMGASSAALAALLKRHWGVPEEETYAAVGR